MKRIEDIKEFEDIDTYYGVLELVEEVFQDRVETHKHLVTANKEIKRLNNIINKAKDKSIELQKKYGYVLDDLTYLLMQGSDKE